MTTSNSERVPRYSLKTLHALYYGSRHGRLPAQGELRLTITDEDHRTFSGYVLSIHAARIAVRTDDGTVHGDIKPAWVDHAEVV